MITIAIINGPNMNMLGKRKPELYGSTTLLQLNSEIKHRYNKIKFVFFQSNYEGEIVEFIQRVNVKGIVINPAAYTHTSIAIRDALELSDAIKVEVHLSDILNREDFRKTNYISDVVDHSIIGGKQQGYFDAIDYIISILNKDNHH